MGHNSARSGSAEAEHSGYATCSRRHTGYVAEPLENSIDPQKRYPTDITSYMRPTTMFGVWGASTFCTHWVLVGNIKKTQCYTLLLPSLSPSQPGPMQWMFVTGTCPVSGRKKGILEWYYCTMKNLDFFFEPGRSSNFHYAGLSRGIFFSTSIFWAKSSK